ncbi:MAG: response regulator [Candidatus Obscuribacterales bacterium]|nr:response regulator [Candidatus Obscuribacterales bacterium]
MKILVAEDDLQLADGLALVLKASGYSVDSVSNGLEADVAVSVHAYDLLILDIGLPGLDGLEVLRRIRQRGQILPILILTARDSLESLVEGLDLGANDYMTKPFQLPELEARIRALLRQGSFLNQTELHFEALSFNTVSRTVTLQEEMLELTARELAVLEILLKRLSAPISKDRITDLLSSWDSELTYNAVGIIIHRLRKKLEPGGITIRSARGLGYKLERSD